MIKKINCTEKKKSGSYITHLSMNWALIKLLFASRLGTSSNKESAPYVSSEATPMTNWSSSIGSMLGTVVQPGPSTILPYYA